MTKEFTNSLPFRRGLALTTGISLGNAAALVTRSLETLGQSWSKTSAAGEIDAQDQPFVIALVSAQRESDFGRGGEPTGVENATGDTAVTWRVGTIKRKEIRRF